MKKRNYSIEAGSVGTLQAPELPYKPKLPAAYRPSIGLIGCGGITKSHLEAYTKGGLTVAAFCDKDLSRARIRRDAFFPEAIVTKDYREVLDRDDIEVVDVATHPAERLPLIREALSAGKHVLSQKPFVLDLDAGAELVALAAEHKVKLAVNQNGRWAPHFSYIRQAIRAGLIGDVLGVHFAVHWNHDWVAGTPFDEIDHLVLYDFAIHWFDALCTFLPDRSPKSVFATRAHSSVQKAKPCLLAQALVEFEGAQASLVFDGSTRAGGYDTTFVVGTKGTLRSEGPDLGRQQVTLTTSDGTGSPDLDGSWFPDGFLGTMGELLCSIEEDREPENSAANNLRSLEVAFAAMRSSETGSPCRPGDVRQISP